MVNLAAVSKGKRHAHALVVEGEPKTQFKCDICSSIRQAGSCRVRCAACDYDECLDCFRASDSISKEHCVHCSGHPSACSCPDGCPKPGLSAKCIQQNPVGRHCRHCKGLAAPCGCPADCTRPPTAVCTPRAAPQRICTNVMLVVDASSTMAGKRWASVLAGIRSIKDELRDGDSMSVITFNDTVSVTKFQPSGKVVIQQVEQTKPGGGARLYDAVAVALHEAVKKHKEGMGTGEMCITSVQVMTCSVDSGSAFDMEELKDIITDANKLSLFKLDITGLGLTKSGRAPLKSLGMVGDKDIQFKKQKEGFFDTSFKEVVSLLQAKKVMAGGGGGGGGGGDGAHEALINLLRSLA